MMKRKQREKFSYGVAMGVVAFSSVATAGTIGFLALKKLQRFVRRTADASCEAKFYEKAWEELMAELVELDNEECEEYEVCFNYND